MNPSTDELLAGIHSVGAEGVLVLPNSPNVVLAAEHAAELSDRDARGARLHVAAGGPRRDGRARSGRERGGSTRPGSTEALADTRTGAVAPAARDDAEGRFVRGDAVGFVDGEVIAWGGAGSTLAATIGALTDGAEIVTIVEGDRRRRSRSTR